MTFMYHQLTVTLVLLIIFCPKVGVLLNPSTICSISSIIIYMSHMFVTSLLLLLPLLLITMCVRILLVLLHKECSKI